MAKRRSSVVVALERARQTMTQDLIARAVADVPSNTTIGEIVTSMRSAGLGKEFEAMAVGELGAALGNGSAPAPRGRPAKRGRKPGRKPGQTASSRKRASGGKVNLRTQEGRDTLEAAVAGFLQSAGSARAEDVRAAVGGDPAQVRKALERLMAAKKASKHGQKRGTTYSWGKAGAR